MSPDTVDTVVTVVLSAGLVASGLLAIASLPWRRSELDAVHRAAVALGRSAVRALVVPEPVESVEPAGLVARRVVAVRALRVG